MNYLIRGLKFVLPYNPGKSGIRTVCPSLEQWGYGTSLSFLTALGLEQWGYEDPSLSVLKTIVSLGLQKWGYGTWGNGTGKQLGLGGNRMCMTITVQLIILLLLRQFKIHEYKVQNIYRNVLL